MCPRLTLTEVHTVLQWPDFFKFFFCNMKTKKSTSLFLHLVHRYGKKTSPPKKTFSKGKIAAIQPHSGDGGGAWEQGEVLQQHKPTIWVV